MEETNTSLPYISDDDETNQIKELKEKLIDLQTKLTSAHNEIEVLSLENINLKRNIEDLQNKNDILKKIASSPAKRKQTPQKKNKKASYTNKNSPQLIRSKSINKIADQRSISSSDCIIKSNEPQSDRSPSQRFKKKKICILCSLIDTNSKFPPARVITTSYSSGYPARVTAWLLIRHQPNQPSGATKAPHPHGVERPAATSKSLNHYSLCWRDSTSCSRVRLRAHDRRGSFPHIFLVPKPGNRCFMTQSEF
ncbi:hypothetical protein ACJJTC_015201 [Scirpophaga incertulas]